MGHTIDEVWEIVKDNQTELNQLKPIKSKLDEVLVAVTESESWRICTLCGGNGVIVDPSGPKYPSPPTHITCPQCLGEKVNVISVVRETAEKAREAFGL